MARRRPFGVKARPPTVDGTASVRCEPLPARTQASLPADEACAPAGPPPTSWRQRCLASAATMVLCPSASVATTLPSSPPVTMRSASAAVARMAPPWTGTLRGSPARGANTSAPSPSTKTAVCPRKCAATTGAPAVTGRVPSPTGGVLARVSPMFSVSSPGLAGRSSTLRQPGARLRASQCPSWDTGCPACAGHDSTNAPPSRHAAGKAFPDLLLGQLAADEDDAAFALLARLPRALVVAVENHVDALEHEALVVVLERQDALAAQNARPLCLHEVLHPGEEFVRVERLIGLERDRLHLFVMIVLQAAVVAMRVAVIMVMVMVVTVAVIMVVIVMVILMMVTAGP